jgi:hypothetical protein
MATLQEKTRAVEDAARLNRRVTTAALAEKYPLPAEDLPPSDSPETLLATQVPVPDWEGLQTFIARELEVARSGLEKAADDRALALQAERRKRQEREAVVEEVYRAFLCIRHLLEGAVGKATTYELLGVTGRTPKRPQDLLRHVSAASRALREPEGLPLDLQLPGLSVSWEELAQALADDAARLEGILGRHREEQRVAELTRLDGDRVQAEAHDVYTGFAQVLQGLYIAAGQRELAARLRLRRPAVAPG